MSKKSLYVVGGPNGAGKTTYAEDSQLRHSSVYLSADLIAAQLSPDDPASQRVTAGRQFLTSLNARLAGSDNLLIETTLSGRSFRRTLKRAREHGFEITLILVFLDCADTCVARVKERVRKGGHHVPEVDVRRRFSRSLANFWNIYRQIADDWFLVYNSGSDFVNVAVGVGDDISIRDEELFSVYLRLAGAESNG
ncbi:MAG: AAA family ATPase [Planctomycetes bacterium]|nr:AAA family ATPase [Planctomycetota bacterium]